MKTKPINIKDLDFRYFEYMVEFTCPYCRKEISFNEQSDPFRHECGHTFTVNYPKVEEVID